MRSAGKEVRAGATANLVRVPPGDPQQVLAAAASTLRFLLSARSAFVSGQVVPVGEPVRALPGGPTAQGPRPEQPLAGQVAVVTGAARGIGAAIAATLAG